MSEIWERQEGETSPSYQKFVIYRDMGAARSLRKVLNALGKKESYFRTLEGICSKYKWVERCRAYDNYVDRQNRIQNEQDIMDMRKRHIQQSLLMQKNVIARIQNTNPQELNINECTKMFDVAVKIERLSRGCDDGQKVSVVNNIDTDSESKRNQRLNRLSLEELEEYRELCRKMNSDDEESAEEQQNSSGTDQ